MLLHEAEKYAVKVLMVKIGNGDEGEYISEGTEDGEEEEESQKRVERKVIK